MSETGSDREEGGRPSPAIPVITLDGDSGCGKSVMAKALAGHLGWHYLNSGLLYRAVALIALARGLQADADTDTLSSVLAEMSVRIESDADGGQRLWLNGADRSLAARTEEVSRLASRLSARSEVRSALLPWQRDCRRSPGLVTEGRDMGTVVFPDAIVKFYLTASKAERARRRYKQLKVLGITANMVEITEAIKARDQRDTGRSLSPSKPASDALILDTTDDTEVDVLRLISETVRKRLGE